MIEIDGSHMEGGGQIIRTSVALSAITGKTCKIINIRAGRKNPGLQRQHLAGIKAVKELCDASVKGSVLGSQSLTFAPNKIKGGILSIDVGSAGSIALVLQALMIPALHCDAPLVVKITGGTINKWAPSVEYIKNVTLEILKKL